MGYDYIKNGDCLELMNEILDRSIDMILCDLPYGISACKWDFELDGKFFHIAKERIDNFYKIERNDIVYNKCELF